MVVDSIDLADECPVTVSEILPVVADEDLDLPDLLDTFFDDDLLTVEQTNLGLNAANDKIDVVGQVLSANSASPHLLDDADLERCELRQ